MRPRLGRGMMTWHDGDSTEMPMQRSRAMREDAQRIRGYADAIRQYLRTLPDTGIDRADAIEQCMAALDLAVEMAGNAIDARGVK